MLATPSSLSSPMAALVLGGGGARAAYQAGVLGYIEESVQGASFPIITGVSAGAINAAYLASHTDTAQGAATGLSKCWSNLSSDQVFKDESPRSLLQRIIGGSIFRKLALGRSLSDVVLRVEPGEALLNTQPLRSYLRDQLPNEEGTLIGIAKNLASGRLDSVCITATNYLTGQSVTWTQGRNFANWQRPNRVGRNTNLSLSHIMASTALPLLFPAEHIDGAWYGDGGIRLTAPLSPAVHLGASSILVISTRYGRSRSEADIPAVAGYPPAAQVMGLLLNAIFLDALDQDAHTLEMLSSLLRHLPETERQGLRPIDILVLRPSIDLGMLASKYEVPVRGSLRLLTRGLGTGETKSPDWLSMLLFDPQYIKTIMQLGWEDALRQRDSLTAFFDRMHATGSNRE